MLYIKETSINNTENHLIYESELIKTNFNKKGLLFKNLRSEYGKCKGKIYIDQKMDLLNVLVIYLKKKKDIQIVKILI